jgi:gluconate kinase
MRHSRSVPLVYVTGSAGSGKSAVVAELKRLGIDAADEDDPQIGSAHNLTSGSPVAVPAADQRSPQWFSEHVWRLRDGVLDQMQARARNELVVLCGNSFPLASAAEVFDLVLHLEMDEDSLRQRITSRVDNDYGQTPSEMDQILGRHRLLIAASRELDVVAIDATQPLGGVAAAVIEIAATV